ncbi:MAG: SUMF1/EgtB/PvdO family nonheme iron enzyme [Deltaproteobacteria bacterium]|nr:SUMF1/EgtB/PvdO family nonheme iron enzyme [Deltaproteobacteria bacterium]
MSMAREPLGERHALLFAAILMGALALYLLDDRPFANPPPSEPRVRPTGLSTLRHDLGVTSAELSVLGVTLLVEVDGESGQIDQAFASLTRELQKLEADARTASREAAGRRSHPRRPLPTPDPYAEGSHVLERAVVSRAIAILRARGIERARLRSTGCELALGAARESTKVLHPRWPGRTLTLVRLADEALLTSRTSTGAFVVLLAPVDDLPFSRVESLAALGASAFETARLAGESALVVSPDGLISRTPSFLARELRGQAVARPPIERSIRIIGGTLRAPDGSAPFKVHEAPVSTNLEAQERRSRDGEMVEVRGRLGEKQVRFFIDRVEVTNESYGRFLASGAAQTHTHCNGDEPPGKDHTPRYWREYRPPAFLAGPAAGLAPFREQTFRDPAHPVVGIDFFDASAFARWAGKRLPAPDEWALACGGGARTWAFGSVWDPKRVNSGGELQGEIDGYVYSAPADSFPKGASVFGALHMSGNVAEWTDSRSGNGPEAVVGGSSRGSATSVRCAAQERRETSFRSFDAGFRCVKDLEGDS